MRTVSHQSLLQIVIFIVFVFNTQFTHSYASIDDENTINKIFETYGKSNVVNFILQRRNGKITIQKNKSFLNATGRPDITLVTAKSINNDLGILKLDISNLDAELDTYIKKESKKKQKKDDSLSKLSSLSDNDDIPLSRILKYQIKTTQSKYNESDNEYERTRLKKELSRLQRKYKEAKYNEKYKPGENSAGNSRQSTKYNRYESSCKSYKTQLQKMTEASNRHQIFFCNDRTYRAEHPKSCGKHKYSKQYSLQEYKDELSRLRNNISKYCRS